MAFNDVDDIVSYLHTHAPETEQNVDYDAIRNGWSRQLFANKGEGLRSIEGAAEHLIAAISGLCPMIAPEVLTIFSGNATVVGLAKGMFADDITHFRTFHDVEEILTYLKENIRGCMETVESLTHRWHKKLFDGFELWRTENVGEYLTDVAYDIYHGESPIRRAAMICRLEVFKGNTSVTALAGVLFAKDIADYIANAASTPLPAAPKASFLTGATITRSHGYINIKYLSGGGCGSPYNGTGFPVDYDHIASVLKHFGCDTRLVTQQKLIALVDDFIPEP